MPPAAWRPPCRGPGRSFPAYRVPLRGSTPSRAAESSSSWLPTESENVPGVIRGRDLSFEFLGDRDCTLHERGVGRREFTLAQEDVVLEPDPDIAAHENRVCRHRKLVAADAGDGPCRPCRDRIDEVRQVARGRGE